MSHLVENTSQLGRRLKITVPHLEVEDKIKSRLEKLSREVRLKGFRPGKVPKQVVEKQFGPSVRGEVIQDLIDQHLRETMIKEALRPAAMPHIEAINEEADGGLEFIATFEIFPKITLADLSQVEIEKKVATITEADIAKTRTLLQEQMGQWEEVDRAAQEGDFLTVDFGRILQEEGAKLEEQKNVALNLTKATLFPELFESLLGKNQGEKIECDVTFPEDFSDNKVAGKKAHFFVTIHTIQVKTPLSEEELLECFSIENNDIHKLNQDIQKRLQESADDRIREDLKEKVLEILIEKNPFEMPKTLLEEEKKTVLQELKHEAKRDNQPFTAPSLEELEEIAKRRVELGLLLNQVIETKEIKVDKAKILEKKKRLAMQVQHSPAMLKALSQNHQWHASIERMVLLEQAIDALILDMKVIEKPTRYEEIMKYHNE